VDHTARRNSLEGTPGPSRTRWGFAAILLVGAGLSTGEALSGTADVIDLQKISYEEGGLEGDLFFARFGASTCATGDLDGDGIGEVVVGGPFAIDPVHGTQGAVWFLFLNPDGTVRASHQIDESLGGFTGDLDLDDEFGCAVASIDHGDGLARFAVGAQLDDDGGPDRGAVWILTVNADGIVVDHRKISAGTGGFTGELDDADHFGSGIAAIGDLDGNGMTELVVGAPWDDDGSFQAGAVWVLFLNGDGSVDHAQKISATEGTLGGPPLSAGDYFGWSVASPGDLDGDEVPDLVVGASGDNDGGLNRGAVWILFLNPDGTVKDEQKISSTHGGFTGALENGDHFGRSVSGIGDLDQDGHVDLAVGATGDDAGSPGAGAVWILFLDADGTVLDHARIDGGSGLLAGRLDTDDYFGSAVAPIGDLNQDGVVDLMVGASYDDDGVIETGATYVLFLNDGIVAVEPDPGVPPAGLLAYPNPTRGAVWVEPGTGGSASRVEVFDVTGARVATIARGPRRASPVRWEGRGLDGRPLPDGVYFLDAGPGARTRVVLRRN